MILPSKTATLPPDSLSTNSFVSALPINRDIISPLSTSRRYVRAITVASNRRPFGGVEGTLMTAAATHFLLSSHRIVQLRPGQLVSDQRVDIIGLRGRIGGLCIGHFDNGCISDFIASFAQVQI